MGLLGNQRVTTFTATSVIRVHVICDACSHAYSHDITIKQTSQSGSPAYEVEQAVRERLATGDLLLNDFPFYWKPCPGCEYVPPWMAAMAKKKRAKTLTLNGAGLGGCFTVPVLFVALWVLNSEYTLRLAVEPRTYLPVGLGLIAVAAALGAILGIRRKRADAREPDWPNANWLKTHPRPSASHTYRVEINPKT